MICLNIEMDSRGPPTFSPVFFSTFAVLLIYTEVCSHKMQYSKNEKSARRDANTAYWL